MTYSSRRRFLQTAAGVGSLGLAGCSRLLEASQSSKGCTQVNLQHNDGDADGLQIYVFDQEGYVEKTSSTVENKKADVSLDRGQYKAIITDHPIDVNNDSEYGDVV